MPLDHTNLAARAAVALAERHGIAPAVITSTSPRTIPVAGGMAGGSADAAGALLACDALWGTKAHARGTPSTSAPTWAATSRSASSGGVAPFRPGRRGELLTPLDTGGTFHWVFAVADGGLSTPAVYRECDRLREASGAGRGRRRRPGPPSPPRRCLDALRTGDRALALGAPSVSNDLLARPRSRCAPRARPPLLRARCGRGRAPPALPPRLRLRADLRPSPWPKGPQGPPRWWRTRWPPRAPAARSGSPRLVPGARLCGRLSEAPRTATTLGSRSIRVMECDGDQPGQR
ncbi:Putative 4-diphosphocytidyl-2-C-methyl-D-erythritol kinase [Streptomyces antimycoticus]